MVEPRFEHWSCCSWWKGTSPDEVTWLNSEEIKPIALAVIELRLSEGISQWDSQSVSQQKNLLNKKFLKFHFVAVCLYTNLIMLPSNIPQQSHFVHWYCFIGTSIPHCGSLIHVQHRQTHQDWYIVQIVMASNYIALLLVDSTPFQHSRTLLSADNLVFVY